MKHPDHEVLTHHTRAMLWSMALMVEDGYETAPTFIYVKEQRPLGVALMRPVIDELQRQLAHGELCVAGQMLGVTSIACVADVYARSGLSTEELAEVPRPSEDPQAHEALQAFLAFKGHDGEEISIPYGRDDNGQVVWRKEETKYLRPAATVSGSLKGLALALEDDPNSDIEPIEGVVPQELVFQFLSKRGHIVEVAT